MNDERCNSCSILPAGNCTKSSSVVSGYALDCSNVNSRYVTGTRLCDHELYLPTTYRESNGAYSTYISSSEESSSISSSNYNGPSSSSSFNNFNHHSEAGNIHGQGSAFFSGDFFGIEDVGVATVVLPVLGFMLLMCITRCCCTFENSSAQRRRQAVSAPPVALIRRPRARAYRRLVQQEDNSIAVELVIEPVAVAKEAIPGNHHGTFEFLECNPDDVTACELKKAVDKNDWESVRDTLARLKEYGDCNQRAYYFGIVSKQIEINWPKRRTELHRNSFSPLLDTWIQSEPNTSDCRILRAQVGTSWAWHARSGAIASMVGEDQWKLFAARLTAASSDLKEASRLAPEDPIVYSTAVPIATGLLKSNCVADILEVGTCLERLEDSANEPLFYWFHVGALQYHSQKWHGSHQDMFSYARSITNDLPAGHPLWVLLPMAHLERDRFQDGRAYWRQHAVRTEIIRAYKQAFPGAAETTPQASTSWDKSLEWTCRNYFALVLAMAEFGEEARRQVRVVGRRPTEQPWKDMNQYKALVDTLGFDIHDDAVSVGESTPVVVAEIV